MKSVNHYEYGEKTVERIKAQRPPTSDFWKVKAFFKIIKNFNKKI